MSYRALWKSRVLDVYRLHHIYVTEDVTKFFELDKFVRLCEFAHEFSSIALYHCNVSIIKDGDAVCRDCLYFQQFLDRKKYRHNTIAEMFSVYSK